jgi:hypothetical protein
VKLGIEPVRWLIEAPSRARHGALVWREPIRSRPGLAQTLEKRGVFADHATVHRWAIKILPVLATAVGVMDPHRQAEDMTAHDCRNTAKIVLHPSAPPRHDNAFVGHRRNKRDRSEVLS